MEQIVDEASVLYRAKIKRRKRKKLRVSIPIVTAAFKTRRSVQNSKGFLHSKRSISQWTQTVLIFLLKVDTHRTDFFLICILYMILNRVKLIV